MSNHCSLGTYDQAVAVYFRDALSVAVSGVKPTPCHTVEIRRNLLQVEPLQFVLSFCESDQLCEQRVTSYHIVRTFYITARNKIALISAKGTEILDVKRVQDVTALGGEIPVPFVLPEERPKDESTTQKSLISAKTPRVERSRGYSAIGHSFSQALDTAYNDALSHLPPQKIPDGTIIVKLVSQTVQYGGIMGQSDLVVELEATYAP